MGMDHEAYEALVALDAIERATMEREIAEQEAREAEEHGFVLTYINGQAVYA